MSAKKAGNNFWRDRPVLVTGCTGLLGSWLTADLVERGASVVGLIRDNVPRTNFLKLRLDQRITTVRGEIEDYFLLERVLNEYEIEAVFHLAAQTIVTIANRNPVSTFETNIKGTWNLLEACRRSPTVKRIVVASSDKAYGDQKKLPYRENAPLQGAHPYDVSKSAADLLATSYWHTYRLPVCVTRCGNLFGGGDLNFNRIVPGTIRSALRNESPIIRSDGTLKRDYFYVRDAADAYLKLAEQMDALKCQGEAFNFSLEQPMTVLEITKAVLAQMKKTDLKPDIRKEASGEILNQYLSAEKARKALGWTPRYSLEEGLTETIQWYEDYFTEQPSGR
ncbi:MAG: NAD-dependent epimerase/dehydratase family protein [Nitrospirae bacterium]|nr:MAG: NAD-dependent epimerase/dehydratase family protein [Nitrospirota bacterium]